MGDNTLVGHDADGGVHVLGRVPHFSGKTIVPFCTNEGSGMGRSRAIRKLCPLQSAQRTRNSGEKVHQARDLSAWLRELGIKSAP